MRIEIKRDIFGYFVKLLGKSAEFSQAVNSLKEMIPEAQRSFDPEKKRWHVALRGKRHLDDWLDVVRLCGAVIVEATNGDRKIDLAAEVRARLLSAQAYKELHLRPDAPPALVRSAYDLLCVVHQADPAKLDTLTWAVTFLIEREKKRAGRVDRSSATMRAVADYQT